MDKKNLILQLKDLAERETHPFKKRAYLKAAQVVTDMTEEEFGARGDFKDIEGIGEAINKKILQFKAMGFIEKWKGLDSPSKIQKSKNVDSIRGF